MSVTGHKSVSSLAIYQRTSDEAKLQMGQMINASMRGNSKALPLQTQITSGQTLAQSLPLPASIQTLTLSLSSSHVNVTQMTEFRNHIAGINLSDLFSNFDTLSQVPYMPVLNGCYIGSINISIN